MMTILEIIEEATQVQLQRGDIMQTKDPTHPPAVCEMRNTYNTHDTIFWRDLKSGTLSNSNVQQGEGASCPNDQKLGL